MIKYFYTKGKESGIQEIELKKFNLKHHKILRNYLKKKFNFDVVVLIYVN